MSRSPPPPSITPPIARETASGSSSAQAAVDEQIGNRGPALRRPTRRLHNLHPMSGAISVVRRQRRADEAILVSCGSCARPLMALAGEGPLEADQDYRHENRDE